MSKDKDLFAFEGKDAVVRWKGSLCIHVAECGRAQDQLFVAGRKPWCQPDLVSVDDAAEVVRRCPTGALTYERLDGGEAEQAAAENMVVVANDGPLYVTGDLDLDGVDSGSTGTRFRVALCRCGASKNKPFCDNSHQGADFRDAGAIGDNGKVLEETGGALKIKPIADGPVMVMGNVTIVSGSGRRAWKGRKAALCRCGASKNKPFCDGAHQKIGFKTP